MRYKVPELIYSLSLSVLLLILLEVFAASFLPAIGIYKLRPAFHIIFVLFLCFRIDTPTLPFLILAIELTHSLFSIEGWAVGTFVGIVSALSISYLKDLIHFSNYLFTMVVVQIFLIGWFILAGSLISLKVGDFSYFTDMFLRYLPQSFVLSVLSPIFFEVLNRIWRVSKHREGVAG